ncbi:MAG: UDP-N-acetylmuramyl-tripeptide synthetase [Parcubacteria group bacterium]|nr:UDP-N-acetylmuramyl-tripeptide synthetase [Parcubacteria group bacterium]
MKKVIKKFTPQFIISAYHWLKAYTAALFYGLPSAKMIIVGVTGTKGKSSTANFIWAGLNSANVKTGLISTANLRIGRREFLNQYHMTMPSPFALQRFLKECLRENCKVAIIEATSEGIKQWRHKGILFDILVFTNLTPEHIEAHGSFEKYRETKQVIFGELSRQGYKSIVPFGHIPKAIIGNADSPEIKNFMKFPADKKITFGIHTPADIKAESVEENEGKVSFVVDNAKINLKILGLFNIYNALPALAAARILNLETEKVVRGLEDLRMIPGRMEIIQSKPYFVVVDYAHEKESITVAINTGRNILGKNGKLILLLGAEGGGRDKTKRKVMGELAGRKADIVVISNVDPYDDDPLEIINGIAEAAIAVGKKDRIDLFRIPDRKEGIACCLRLARPGDVVMITGKGAEQSLVIGNKKIPWDDRVITRQELKKMV